MSVTPTSPNSSTTPTIVGQSSADTTLVTLYANSLCTSVLESGTKAIFESAGLTLNVSPHATTTIYAKASDSANNGSACVTLTDYINNASLVCTSSGLRPALKVASGVSHTCALESGGP